jgi:hypothetical protein
VAANRSSVICKISQEKLIPAGQRPITGCGILPDPAASGRIELNMIDAISSPRTPFGANRPANQLEDQLQESVRNSFEYQILRRTLSPDSELPPETTSQADAAEPQISAEGLSAAALSTQAQSTGQGVEQSELNLTVGSTPAPAKSDPLVLDLAGNGFSTSGLQNTQRFDLNADGVTDDISAPTGDDALLVLDRNRNGRIDNGSELFGDQNGSANGFAELAKYDDNRDGLINQQDAVYADLRLMKFDSQGRQQLQSLEQAGVASIQLKATDVRLALGAYDEIAQLGTFEFSNGRKGQAADLLLARR